MSHDKPILGTYVHQDQGRRDPGAKGLIFFFPAGASSTRAGREVVKVIKRLFTERIFMVVTRWTARSTHKGEFMKIAPTGNQVTMMGIEATSKK